MGQVPNMIPPKLGALKIGFTMRRFLVETVKESSLTREQLVERMSELLGTRITVAMLNRWLAYGTEAWRFPLEYLPAFETALETHALLEWIAEKRGARLLVGREIMEYELGKAMLMKTELRRHEARIKKALGDQHG
jgi:hypothetical protein